MEKEKLTIDDALDFIGEKIDILNGNLAHAKYVIHNKKIEDCVNDELIQYKNVFNFLTDIKYKE